MNATAKTPGWTARSMRAAVNFVAAPASAAPLAAYRIGVAAVLLLQALAMAGSLDDLFHARGIVQWSVIEESAAPGCPRLSWFADALAPFDVEPWTSVQLAFLVYIGALSCLLIGWRTRPSAFVAWFIHVALRTTGAASIYGVDHFANISLFFFLWMPIADVASMDRWAGRRSGEPSAAARLSLRVLQLQMCIVYFASGVEKATGPSWWNGEVIFAALMRPDLGQFDFSWLARFPWLAVLACWGTLMVEIGYSIFVWPRFMRTPWVLLTISLHLGIAVALGLWSFSALMIVLNVSAFLVSPEPKTAVDREGT